ncbi:MAG: peptidylprolyl isomerase [Rhodobacteraceae bacterium]|nr:peptidylprolyl isomerase [Paracoccaceae bacterium]
MRLNLIPKSVRVLCLAAAGLAAGPVLAQGDFAPVARVDDRVVTRHELDQRTRFFTLLRAPGDPGELALDRLIEERLQLAAAESDGITVPPEAVEAGMAEFAARANLSAEEFVAALAQAGVQETTFRDFVAVGVAWREVVRARFAPQAAVSDTEVDRALATAAPGTEDRVLLSEILLPATTPESRRASLERARRIAAQVGSVDDFADAAHRVSSAASRSQGGARDWVRVTALPPEVQAEVARLQPGQVSRPIETEDTVALFFLRERDVPQGGDTGVPTLDYVTFSVPGGDLGRVAAEVQTCDEVFAEARAGRTAQPQRQAQPTAQVPAGVAGVLAGLDAGEIAALPGGGAVMLCARTLGINFDAARAEVRGQLLNQQVGAQAAQYLAELRSRAIIQILE